MLPQISPRPPGAWGPHRLLSAAGAPSGRHHDDLCGSECALQPGRTEAGAAGGVFFLASCFVAVSQDTLVHFAWMFGL